MSSHVIIIGSGIGGLASACLLGKAGYAVTVVEKNDQLGGRAGVFSADGFRFDMGPSWYLMPDIFEHFFHLLGEKLEDHLTLEKLQPSYRVFFEDHHHTVDLFADLDRDIQVFEQLEPGAAAKFEAFLQQSRKKYTIAKEQFLYRNYDSLFDFLNLKTAYLGTKLSAFFSMDRYVRKFFTSDEMQKILQYTLVFLGGAPSNTPALYSLMTAVDFDYGVYYPEGGIYRIIEVLQSLGEQYGVTYKLNAEVDSITVDRGNVTGVQLQSGEILQADMVISNADVHHTDTVLLPDDYQTKSYKYWEKRTLAPSAFMLYLGVDGPVDSLVHHNLLFSKDWETNFGHIFTKPQWPDDPSFYICCPSKTDATVAPEGKENMFVLVPIAANLEGDDQQLDQYEAFVLNLVEQRMNIPNLRDRIVYKRRFCVEDFRQRYNAFGGSALGLAHTLGQTAIFRPNNVHPKLKNFFYVGAGTNPGIGMPICLVSAELAYKRIIGDRSVGPLEKL